MNEDKFIVNREYCLLNNEKYGVKSHNKLILAGSIDLAVIVD